ncbi:unnamed protein product [Adineta steineri]|uniref:Uncharacterized protein n=2 Tax=Adineta steineri TaxID=433720 RepID=A0A819UH15_9BILA|nr:unnamed protein product [Adineta steineri]
MNCKRNNKIGQLYNKYEKKRIDEYNKNDYKYSLTNVAMHMPITIATTITTPKENKDDAPLHTPNLDKNKHLRLPIDWQYFFNDKIQNHFSDLIQSSYTFMCFIKIEQGEYVMAERIVIFSQGNNSDVLVVDNITWKRITLTF